MRHQHQLAPDTDPDIAEPVRQRGMKHGEIGLDRLHHQDRVVLGERVLADHPVIPALLDVGADNTAQRHEGHALL